MLSRVANSVYWLARYLERMENYARFIKVNINLSIDLSKNINSQIDTLMTATCDDVVYNSIFQDEKSEGALYFLTFDYLNPNSVYNMLHNARENGRTVREVVPREFWEGLNRFFLDFREFKDSGKHELYELLDIYEWIKQQCQFLTGMLDATLSRNEVYYFFNLGRFIERADKTSRALDMIYFNENQTSVMDVSIGSAILKSASAFNMYRQQYKNIRLNLILEFLINDRYFPRSLFFCVSRIKEAVLNMGGNLNNDLVKENEQIIKMLTSMNYEQMDSHSLHQFVNDFQIRNNHLDHLIFKLYFDIN